MYKGGKGVLSICQRLWMWIIRVVAMEKVIGDACEVLGRYGSGKAKACRDE